MSNAGSQDVETRTVGTRLIYFMSVLAHFTIFPLGDFLHIFTEIAASTKLNLFYFSIIKFCVYSVQCLVQLKKRLEYNDDFHSRLHSFENIH